MDIQDITYGQLEFLLAELGYRLTQKPGGPHIWENEEFDAVKFLPVEPTDAPARVDHLMTIRKVSIEKGIVDADTFETLLEKARGRKLGPVASHSAA